MNTVRPPDEHYFQVMADSAPSHWWYTARRALFEQLLAGLVPRGATALDVGCGTGETMALLHQLGATRVAGTDISEDALAHARGRGAGGTVMAALAERLPCADGRVDVLVSSDVLEHLTDDRVALTEYRRVMRPGATLLVTVPSYRWLWSELDERAGHHRRYRLGELTEAVGACGFAVQRASYFFSFLVPPAIAIRRTPLGRLTPATDEDASGGPLATAVLSRLAAGERQLLRRRDLPFGLSAVVVATAS